MPSDRKPSLILPATFGVALMLLVGYVGAYYWQVIPVKTRWGIQARYRVEGDASWAYRSRRWVNLFAPIHWLDRRVRPHVWESRVDQIERALGTE
jgi:hypothetical protein